MYNDNYYLGFPLEQFLGNIYSGFNQIQGINPFFINNPNIRYALNDIYNGLAQIQHGLAIEYASTGMPICNLNRWTRGLAQLKNIGNGNAWNGIAIVINTSNQIHYVRGYLDSYNMNYAFYY